MTTGPLLLFTGTTCSHTATGKLATRGYNGTSQWYPHFDIVLALTGIKHRFLVDPATLTVVNRWRRERGEPELLVSDYVTAEGTSAV